MPNQIEVEIKSLLGTEDNAKKLLKQILSEGFEFVTKNSQLNHYFMGNAFGFLAAIDEKWFVSTDSFFELQDILTRSFQAQSKISLRTRQLGSKVFLVLKASLNSDSSQNGTVRLEFEKELLISLEQIDTFLCSIGFQNQAKWSRQRAEYSNGDITICLDKNAGYGYLLELEKIVPTDEDPAIAKSQIIKLMNKLNIKELDQSRLARMFDFYNNNWQDYYGTDKIFEIE